MIRLRSSTVVVVAAILAGCAPSKPPAAPPATSSGALKIDLAIAPDPPSTGDNHLRVALHDENGAPVDGAALELVYDMAAMGSMPEMKGSGEVVAEGAGRYDISYPLAANGDWALTLDVTAAGHAPQSLRLKVAPPRRGFVLESGQPSETGHGAGTGPFVEIPPERRQLIGLTFAPVERRPLAIELRAAGRVEVDERKLADVTLKYDAYVKELLVAETGRSVRAGEPLLRLYSPDLFSAEEDLLQAGGAPGSNGLVQSAARRRLRLWDLSDAQIAAVEHRGTADGTLVLQSPVSGTVLERSVVEGARVASGLVLYRIGSLGRVWLQAEFHEADAPLVAVGETAAITLPSQSGIALSGRITFVSPMVDEKTRTLRARIELPNAFLALKPGMFADVRLQRPLGNRLAVPDQALLMTGEHRYAFVDRGEGRLQPVEVTVGALTGEYDEVLSGLSEGDRVVLGAAFLVASEAQLRNVLPRWSPP